MLDRLGPKKILIVSSAPQIRYPDCYGIDGKTRRFYCISCCIVSSSREWKQRKHCLKNLQKMY